MSNVMNMPFPTIAGNVQTPESAIPNMFEKWNKIDLPGGFKDRRHGTFGGRGGGGWGGGGGAGGGGGHVFYGGTHYHGSVQQAGGDVNIVSGGEGSIHTASAIGDKAIKGLGRAGAFQQTAEAHNPSTAGSVQGGREPMTEMPGAANPPGLRPALNPATKPIPGSGAPVPPAAVPPVPGAPTTPPAPFAPPESHTPAAQLPSMDVTGGLKPPAPPGSKGAMDVTHGLPAPKAPGSSFPPPPTREEAKAFESSQGSSSGLMADAIRRHIEGQEAGKETPPAPVTPPAGAGGPAAQKMAEGITKTGSMDEQLGNPAPVTTDRRKSDPSKGATRTLAKALVTGFGGQIHETVGRRAQARAEQTREYHGTALSPGEHPIGRAGSLAVGGAQLGFDLGKDVYQERRSGDAGWKKLGTTREAVERQSRAVSAKPGQGPTTFQASSASNMYSISNYFESVHKAQLGGRHPEGLSGKRAAARAGTTEHQIRKGVKAHRMANS